MRSPLMVWGLGTLGVVILCLGYAGVFQGEIINPGGWGQVWQFIAASAQPDLSPELLRVTGKATLVTLSYAVCGTFLNLLLAIGGGLLSSEVWWLSVFPDRSRGRPPALWLGVRALLAIPRAIHELVWGLFFVNIWGLDPLGAILAIGIPFGAITAKVFADILDETPRQALTVLLNSGVAAPSAFAYSLIPQAFLNLLSYTFYRFECSIRSAAVLGIIGAGGLGYEILLSLQSLQYRQLWTLIDALIILNGLVDFGSAWLRQQLGCPNRMDLTVHAPNRTVGETRSPYLLLPVLLLVPICFWYLHPNVAHLWAPRTGKLLTQIVQASLPPDFSLVPQLLPLSLQTLAMSVPAIAVAALGGLILAFPAAHNLFLPGGILHRSRSGIGGRSGAWGLLLLARMILLLCRAIPAPIWALVILFVFFPGILPGALALGLHNLGILGRLLAEVIENLDQRPLEALQAQGSPPSLLFLYGVLPLTLPRFLAYALYRWEVCMRETVIVGVVGAGGLGQLLTEQLSSFDYRGVVTTLGCLVLLTFSVDWFSGMMRRSLR
ncbi:phosphate ABC transporter permease [Leptolyngbya sp. 'hensonii']|uniref:PhnE/PtxC family ABC transporter permease n=1 Tax=Leptolyngbya sp. 'hensonii' TaxID=1922337 RepID=UPI0009604519|nr:ABC transporter permease subunit [Leptolyngbya sp. 'hensonii']OLP16884.1 phosphate ABC transporter permease [Leptolyngbya sp. 'hensonii']